ncbi:sperm acrosome membrane-associated protein 6-like isoform X1 [Paroedura picta]|uniref:sperm acrosome membrane-associated protein 6-like isoform X1 n=2 Tax=Paroedura picta TaxID=143630 RepID=UPI0040565398
MTPTGYPVLLWLAFSSQAGACLYCFSTEGKRIRVCEYFLGYANGQQKACLSALTAAFQPYVKIQVGVSEMEKLKDIFGRILFYLEEKGMAKVPYPQAIPEAAAKVQKEVEGLQAAPACIPPCGFQKEARSYRCDSCHVTDCPLPIDCPIRYVHKAEGDITILRCTVKFTIPPETIIRWKFAKDIISQDLAYFEVLYTGMDLTFLIRPTTGAHGGTYACEIAEEDDVLVRKFFYLNVTVKRLGKEKELQAMFHDILNPPPGVASVEVVEPISSLQDLLQDPDSLRKTGVLLLLLGLFLSSMLVTLLLMGVYFWATDVK